MLRVHFLGVGIPYSATTSVLLQTTVCSHLKEAERQTDVIADSCFWFGHETVSLIRQGNQCYHGWTDGCVMLCCFYNSTSGQGVVSLTGLCWGCILGTFSTLKIYFGPCPPQILRFMNGNLTKMTPENYQCPHIFSCDQAALWMVFSVRLSVCHTFLSMFPSSYHHEIFRSYHIGPG